MSDNARQDQELAEREQLDQNVKHGERMRAGCLCGYPVVYARNAGTQYFEIVIQDGQKHDGCPFHGRKE